MESKPGEPSEPFDSGGSAGAERITRTVDPLMRKRIEEIYRETPHERIGFISPEKFVDLIALRAFEEWRNDTKSQGLQAEEGYDGRALNDFVRDETHYFLIGRGHTWFTGVSAFWHYGGRTYKIEAEEYGQARDSVLKGLSRRAVELFSDWNGCVNPALGLCDKRNLRANLADYLFLEPPNPASFELTPLSECDEAS